VFTMRKTFILTMIVLFLAILAFAANKESGSTTLKDVQPAGTTDKKHKKQQFDLSFMSPKNDYTCRTNENEKVNATDWVVGSSINYKINGNKGEIKNTQSNKNVKCMVVRVAAVTAPPQ
jgi:hypothetical protein